MSVPKKVSERITAGLKRLVPIIQQQRARDVSEAGTHAAMYMQLINEPIAAILGVIYGPIFLSD